ncbi:hypothetical protein IJ090_00545, partial [Candidatus Saccharibacteria bacterium]|nr:hypothetical protein [Candidatus Saccharibacteria bacterium]
MKKDPGLTYVLILMFGDALAIVAAFLFAYFVRTNLDSRPFYFVQGPWEFTSTILILVPVWWIILALLGLYNKRVYNSRSRFSEIARSFAAAGLGMMFLISFEFFAKVRLFPSRSVALWALVFCFVTLVLVRLLTRFLRRLLSPHL